MYVSCIIYPSSNIHDLYVTMKLEILVVYYIQRDNII